ncbi:MAG: PAS domain-containing protein [Jhaorihella sp.]
MERFRNGRSLSPIRQAEAYWTALRSNADVPSRAQIDPRGLGNVLHHAFMLERIAPGHARFRLAGQHLIELAGMEVRGMPLTAFFVPAARSRIASVLDAVFGRPSVAELTLDIVPDRAVGEARMLLLPLRCDRGEISRALGVLVAERAAGALPPCRFDLSATAMRPVGGASPGRPEPAIPGFAESQAPLGGRAPHLRVVK